ncbi:hypothetical protein SAMN02745181_2209 [Rubritalea squalenifaciens DSM 18772]|uniref:Uncharacterized protein n=2 Tax=Rubritalea TaxID=361050 RepID=A0A1M6KUI8_9BACT|nr:hypothetical protein SAMN02745181_2209 [Rubritalea squalenifaciens DSM 18772]
MIIKRSKGSSVESFGAMMFGGSSIISKRSYSKYFWMGHGFNSKQKGSRELHT